MSRARFTLDTMLGGCDSNGMARKRGKKKGGGWQGKPAAPRKPPWSWLAVALALASAILVVQASPPRDFWPLALIGLAPLLWAIRDATAGRALLLGWITGVALNLVACSWWPGVIGRYVSMSDTAAWAWALGICTYQGLAFGIWAWLSNLLARRGGISWLLAAPLVLVLVETLIPFPFEWYLGMTLWRVWPLIQIAELGGVAAVSGLVVLVNLIIVESAVSLRASQPPSRATAISLGVLLGLVGVGSLRAYQVGAARAEAPMHKVGILQPNFGITSMDDRKRHGRHYLEALQKGTRELAEQGAQLVVWPESSWPYLFDRALKREFAKGHPWELRPGADQVQLLVGALTHDFGTADVYNSAVLIAADGQIAGSYDKLQLVPIGEYIPLESTFPERAEKLRERLPEFPEILRGDGYHTLVDGDLRIAPLICSEDLEGDLVLEAAGDANLLVAITNDAWFGASWAPHQHLAAAAFRAVEARRDYVRTTNTGVSAHVDAVGRVRLEGPLLDVDPDPENIRPTLMLAAPTLLEITSLGPWTIRYFPHACLSVLIAALLFRWTESSD